MNNRKGFTLVECIVAIAIIAMLSTLAITVFQTTVKATNDQWNKFQVLQMGQNVLSCFSSSDDISDFERHLDAINAVGSAQESEIQLKPDTHNEFDPNNTPMPIPFSKIRAYESGTVSFMNGENSIADFEYGEKTAQYIADTAILSNANGIYKKDSEQNEVGASKIIKVDGSEKDNGSYSVKYENGKVEMTYKISKEKSVEWDFTAFDQYLFDQNYYLVLIADDFRSFASAAFALYQVYDAETQTPIKDSQNRSLYYYVRSDCSTYTNIKSVHYIFSSKTPSTSYTLSNNVSDDEIELKDEDGNTFSSFVWQYQGVIHPNFEKIDTAKCEYTPSSVGGLIYTEYSLKSGHTSEIHYALVDGTTVQLFNGTSADADMIFKYTGNDRNSPLAELGLVHKGKDEDTGLDLYFKVWGNLPIKKVTFDDAAKTIRFLDGSDNVVVFFLYTDNDTYQQDKGDIHNSDGAYHSFYNTDYSLKNEGNVYIRKGVDLSNKVYYQLVVGENPIFVSYAATIGIKNSSNMNDSFAKINNTLSQVEQTINAITKYYSYSMGRHVMVAKATFSKYVGSIEMEPQLKIWIMDSAAFDSWKQLSGETPTEPTSGGLIISYRKG